MSNVSAAQLAANRANAQKSSGPVSPEGKAKSSLNAVKTGLTGQTILLSSEEEAEAYKAHVARHVSRFSPATEEEQTLVQFLADTEWRLLRIAPLESAIYAKGRRDFGHLFTDESDPTVREALIRLEIANVYRKDLNNLALQERRLRNHYKSDLERLQVVQKEREEKAAMASKKLFDDMYCARNALKRADANEQSFNPAEFGFDFSVEEIRHCDAELHRVREAINRNPSLEKVLADFRNAKKGAKAA